MFTTTVRPEYKRLISEQEAYARATPAQRALWFPHGMPAGKGTLPAQYGDGPDGGPDRANLQRALLAGQRALQAGYGGVLPDGQAPCGACPSCTYGHPEGCRRPSSKAMARLQAAQAADADRTRDQVILAELEGLTVELAARLG
jgi:hypothetical protein